MDLGNDKSGLSEAQQKPSDIKFHRRSKTLELIYTHSSITLPCEYLRVFSPSAEVRGHGIDEAVLQTGKIDVNLIAIEPMGNYALRLGFDDGHDSGIYSWSYLFELGQNHATNWQDYLAKLKAAGASRESITEQKPITMGTFNPVTGETSPKG